ncbi:hypothetical protein [Klebsiella aerogenes]|uniref:hypothetical protein n=1 Tax=Klebsiella aerogenes TaxID=548 RepID=UPI003512472C|nr:hypothetical protein [Klebsiella aerogenes]
MMTAMMVAGGAALGRSLGRGAVGNSRSSSSTHDSTTHKESWLAPTVEPIITDLLNGGMDVNYINQQIAGLTPAEQAALSYFGSGAGIQTGQNVSKWGAGMVNSGVGLYKDLLSGNTGVNKDAFKSDVLGLYNGAGDFMNTQNAAIEQQASVNIANNLAGNAESFNNTNNGVSGSSMQNNANMAVMQQGMNSAAQREADISNMVMKGAVGLTANGMAMQAGLIANGAKGAIGLGQNAFTQGLKMSSTAAANQFKSGLFQQYYNQEVINNNRQNGMINSNLPLMETLMALNTASGWSNIDTTTTSHSESSSKSKSGLFH